MLGTIIYLVVGVILVISLAFLGLFSWFFVNVTRGIQRDHAAVKRFSKWKL